MFPSEYFIRPFFDAGYFPGTEGAAPSVPGAEYELSSHRLHYELDSRRLHYEVNEE